MTAFAVIASSCGPSAEVDLVLRGGTIVDGTGRPAYTGDVAISGGTIAAVGDLGRTHGVEELDVSGLVVAPGFVNLHSHARYDGLPTAENMLGQGVTTEILNADGGGPLDLDEQLREVEGNGLAVNVGTNVALGTIWAEVNGREATRPTADQLREMNDLVLSGLGQGAWGVSAGLDYKPSYYSTTDEIVAVLEGAGAWETVFTNHDRITPESGFSSMAGMRETVTIGEATGLVPVITHMKVQGHEQGSIDEVLAMMDSATARGAFTAADVYPYLAGQTSLAALIIPGWAQEGGGEATRARFADPALRSRIVREADEAIVARFGGPEGVYLPGSAIELTTMMAELGATSGGDAVVRILETDNPSAILRFGAESDLEAILRYPTASVACDCDASIGRTGHPRGYGTFPRVLGRYVREQGVLTLEEAVRKMSGLPATTIGMVDRGFIAVGMAADLTVFDAETIIDHSTYEAPTEPSTGVEHVLVNGVFAWRDGSITGGRGGRALRRPPSHPARALELEEARSVRFEGVVAAEGDGEPFVLRVDVRQAADGRSAEGRVVIEHEDGSVSETESLGLLQTRDSWAALSMRMVDADGVAHGGHVVIDGANPLRSDGIVTVVLVLDGGTPITGTSDGTIVVG